MNKKQIKAEGRSWAQGIPENNYQKPFQHCIEQRFNWEEDEIFIKETAFNEFWMAEQHSRQFTPFEFTAKELNKLSEVAPYDPWEVFEDGCNQYYEQWWKDKAKTLWMQMIVNSLKEGDDDRRDA